MHNPIYTELTSCRDCYKCVRGCPVKAIQIRDNRAMVVHDRCTYCGKCVHLCPNNAKKVRNDTERVKLALASGRRVICSLAPSYVAEFPGEEEALVIALKRLGFSGVSETAIGATLVTEALDIYSSEHGGSCPFIGTACPSVVELVRKYFPEKVGKLAPVPSPLQTHSAYLRHIYPGDLTIVFIGPCVAKKLEADQTPGYPDLALTFTELRSWLDSEGIDLSKVKSGDSSLIPCKAGIASIYPIEGGQIKSSCLWGSDPLSPDAVPLSGSSQVLSALEGEDSAFLELLSCEGGCINGPGAASRSSVAEKKRRTSAWTGRRLQEMDVFKGDEAFARLLLEKGYSILGPGKPSRAVRRRHTEEEISSALHTLGKFTKQDELNCGGCGYNTCRDMALALLDGMAEVEMCVTKMRKEAESKVDVLLRNIPMGVVIVDTDLLIADCNAAFLELFTDMAPEVMDQELVSSMEGLPLDSFVPFAERFRDQFYIPRPGQYRIHYKDKFLRLTFFMVEEDRLLGAMFEDITSPTIRRETVVKRAEDVIQKSLETVQQIASLLGENAAETEIMLNSLIEAFSVHGTTNEAEEFAVDADGDLS